MVYLTQGLLSNCVCEHWRVPSGFKGQKNGGDQALYSQPECASHRSDRVQRALEKVPAFARLHERTLGWFEALGINMSYYEKYEAGSIFQPGGVSLWSRRPPNTVHRPRPKWPRMVGLDALQRKRRHSLASGHSVPTGTEYLWRIISVESTKGQFRSKRR